MMKIPLTSFQSSANCVSGAASHRSSLAKLRHRPRNNLYKARHSGAALLNDQCPSRIIAMIQKPTPRRLVVISDYQAGGPFPDTIPPIEYFEQQWRSGERGEPASRSEVIPDFRVEGGYIERL